MMKITSVYSPLGDLENSYRERGEKINLALRLSKFERVGDFLEFAITVYKLRINDGSPTVVLFFNFINRRIFGVVVVATLRNTHWPHA